MAILLWIIVHGFSEAKAVAKRAAFDDFLNDFRVEQQKYVRKSRLFFITRQVLVVGERLLKLC